MKKIGFFLGLIVCFLFLSVLPAFAQVAYPGPRGYVNDFANILPDELEQKLEMALRDYERKTTNEIAVVTVSSLEGLTVEEYTIGLAEKWGVGKKGRDNGAVLLVAPNERKVRIEVGYGLEPVLTDAKAKRIIESMTPYFKRNDYAGGISAGVQGITETIGYLTPLEIEQQKKEQEKRDQAAMSLFLNVLMFIGATVVFLIVVIILWKKVSAWQKEQKRRESVRREALGNIKTVEDGLEEIARDIEEKLSGGAMDNKRYPADLEMKRAGIVANSDWAKKIIKAMLQEARELLRKNPDLAKAKIAEAQNTARLYQEELKAFQGELDVFNQARLSHERIMQKADQSIQDTITYLNELIEKGYFVPPEKELAEALRGVKRARDVLSIKDDVPDYCLVVEYAGSAASKALLVRDAWEKRLGLEQANSRSLNQLSSWLEQTLPQLESSYRAAMEELKVKTPRDVWEPLAKVAEQKGAIIEFRNLFVTAGHVNGMKQQKFESAAKVIMDINGLKKGIESLFEEPAKILQGFIEARDKAKILASQAAQVVISAESAVKDSDAEGVGRSKLQKAKDSISKAENLEKSDLPNWLLVAGLFMGAIALAKSAESEAKNRTDEAERARRHRHEEEEHQRYVHSSWSSGGYSGGGGFGGGGFGGGGASGGW